MPKSGSMEGMWFPGCTEPSCRAEAILEGFNFLHGYMWARFSSIWLTGGKSTSLSWHLLKRKKNSVFYLERWPPVWLSSLKDFHLRKLNTAQGSLDNAVGAPLLLLHSDEHNHKAATEEAWTGTMHRSAGWAKPSTGLGMSAVKSHVYLGHCGVPMKYIRKLGKTTVKGQLVLCPQKFQTHSWIVHESRIPFTGESFKKWLVDQPQGIMLKCYEKLVWIIKIQNIL